MNAIFDFYSNVESKVMFPNRPNGFSDFAFYILLPALIGILAATFRFRFSPTISGGSEYLSRFPAALLFGTLCVPVWLFAWLLFHFLHTGGFAAGEILRNTFAALIISGVATWPLWSVAGATFLLHRGLRGSGWPKLSDLVSVTFTILAFVGQYLFLLAFDGS